MDYKYLEGRFFISPLIGCRSNCIYCYLANELEKSNIIRRNKNDIEKTLVEIRKDKRFKAGKGGSIISIGAYCDIFPISDEDLICFSVNWVVNALKLGNPVQIISKNVLPKDLVKHISKNIQYPKQFLYSTTITSFSHWHRLERNTSAPDSRLETLKLFADNGIPTNVMIKPFLPGLTDLDIDKFISKFIKYKVDYCVVGDLYVVDDKIWGFLNIVNDNNGEQGVVESYNVDVLDCTENKYYKIVLDHRLDQFIKKLKENGINVFKKSSCVNANILNVNNTSGYYKKCGNKYCLQCGNCNI